MRKRLVALIKRWWHCFHHTVRFQSGHCEFDYAVREFEDGNVRHFHGCTCGRIFYSDFDIYENVELLKMPARLHAEFSRK